MDLTKVDPSYKLRILNTLTKYFKLLENDEIQLILPDIDYQWKHYNENKRDLLYITEVLAKCDSYWLNKANLDWSQREHGTNLGLHFTDSPGLSRLPDDAKLALWQELDSIYYEYETMQQLALKEDNKYDPENY